MKYTATLTDGSKVELELRADPVEWTRVGWSVGMGDRHWLMSDDGAALVNLDHVMSIVPADRAQAPSEAPEIHRDADGSEWIGDSDGRYRIKGGRGPAWTLEEIKDMYGTWGESKRSDERSQVRYADHPWRA